MSATARHGEVALLQVAAQPCMNDIIEAACDKRNHTDSMRSNAGLEGTGYRPADQRIDTQFGKTGGLSCGGFVRQTFILFVDDSSIGDLDDANLPCHVEYRRDPVVPDRECCFHPSAIFLPPNSHVDSIRRANPVQPTFVRARGPSGGIKMEYGVAITHCLRCWMVAGVLL